MAALGIALVVMVMIWTLALAQGFRSTLVATGRADRALLMRGGATSEISSFVSREATGIVRAMPEVEKDAAGNPLASPEIVVIISLPKKSDGTLANISARGVSPAAFAMRPELEIVE